MRSFTFLEAHLTIRTDTRWFGKVPQVMEEGEADDDDTSSVQSSSQPSTSAQASSSQAGPSHVKAAGAPGPRHQVVQDGRNDQIAWWQYSGLEANKLSEDLWMSFVQESFSMILHFRQLQQQ